jgi:hypothetical protein
MNPFEEVYTHQLDEALLAKTNTIGWDLPLADLVLAESIRDRVFRVHNTTP